MASNGVLARSEGEGHAKLFPGTLSNERMLAHGPKGRNRGLPLVRGWSAYAKGAPQRHSAILHDDHVVDPINLLWAFENHFVRTRPRGSPGFVCDQLLQPKGL